MPGAVRRQLKPDAHLITANPKTGREAHVFVEVDRATESLRWITTKAQSVHDYWSTGQAQAANGVFPLTLWIAPDQPRAEGLTRALSRLPAEHWPLHQVTTDDNATDRILALTQPADVTS